MKTQLQLPENYQKLFQIDLQKDKKLALQVNGLALAIAVPVLLLGFWLEPIGTFLDEGALGVLWVLLGMVVYMVLHELVHGIFMRWFSGVRPHYGVTALYAYAGSDAYFDRTHYIIIALAPVVVWGLVLGVLCLVTEGYWFWLFYLLEMVNLSGAAGDIYVTWRFSKLSSNILVQDTGVAMTVYDTI